MNFDHTLTVSILSFVHKLILASPVGIPENPYTMEEPMPDLRVSRVEMPLWWLRSLLSVEAMCHLFDE